jgi:hypothetical protein
MSDINTREDALKALSDIRVEQKRLSDSNRDLRENLEAKAATVKEVQQKLAELAAPKVQTVSEKETTLRTYIRPDGSLDAVAMCSDEVDRGEWHADFKRLVDDRNLVKMLKADGRTPKMDGRIARHMESAPDIIQRVFSDAGTVGADWIPDVLVPELAKAVYTPKAVEQLFATWDMQSKNLEIPFQTLTVKPYLKSASTYGTITADDDAATKVSVVAQSIAARISADEDSTEDALMGALSVLRDSVADSISSGVEDAIINGDDQANHQDLDVAASPNVWDIRGRWGAGTGTASDHRRAWLGLRAHSFDAGSTLDVAAQTYAALMALRAKLSGPQGAGGDLALIISPEAYVTFLLDLEQIATVDKFPMATILSGQVASIAGMPVVVSDYIGADMEATGYHAAPFTGEKTGCLIVNRSRYFMGNYRQIQTSVQREIVNGLVDIVSTRRCVFFSLDSASTASVAYGFNI